MRLFKYIFPIAAFLLATACSDEVATIDDPVKEIPSDMFKVGLSLNVADMTPAQTRAFSNTPDYANLELHILEFELGNTPFEGSNLTNDYSEKVEKTVLNGDGDIHYDLTLYKAFEPRVLHFIAVPEGTELNITPGLEGTVIPSLIVSGNTPAYWQRIEFPDGYGTFDADGEWTEYSYVKTKLEHVPMICNFSKISFTSSAPNFTFEGFQVINQPHSGYIAPWDAEKMEFPNFLSNDNRILPYNDINAVYKGRTPNNEADMKEPGTDFSPADNTTFIYERPTSSINNPVLIMKGRRNTDTESKYYKLDLGYLNTNKLFSYYNILRNFQYAISVTKVEAEGYPTAQQALDGVVFNNFSFDVNTRSMLSVSNGTDMISVNQTTFVVTNSDDTTITFRFKYLSDISSGGGTVTNGDDVIDFIGLEAGNAIQSVIKGNTDSDGWRTVTITTVEPSATRKQQDFIVYNKETGLGRTISIIVRTPWLYTNAGVWGGNYNYYQQFIDNVEAREEWNGYVSSNPEIGQPLTVRFHIDDNIPEAMFPLYFTFESNRQNIENNKIGNLIVNYGPSYFDPTKTTIKYTKTVTWADYNSELKQDNETGTIVDDDNDGVTSHVVRARFQTILPVVTGEQTIIRVYNPYMRVQGSASQYLDVTFTGKEGTAPNYE